MQCFLLPINITGRNIRHVIPLDRDGIPYRRKDHLGTDLCRVPEFFGG